MRFPTVFYRQYGSASAAPELGSDAAPSPTANGALPGGYAPPTPEQAVSTDCQINVRQRDMQGNPVQKIGVAYGYTGAGGAPALTAKLWFLEEQSGLWFLADAQKTLTAGGIVYFDALPMSDPPAFGGGSMPGTTPDASIYAGVVTSMRFYLQVALVGTVTGVYTFGMAPMLNANP